MLDGKQFRDESVAPRKWSAPLAVAYAPAISLDTAAARDFAIGTLTGSTVVTLAQPAAGRQGSILVQQDGTGGRTVLIAAAGFARYRDTALPNLDAASGGGAITVYTYAMSVVGGVGILEIGRRILVGDYPSDALLYDGDHTPLVDADLQDLTLG